MRISFLPSPKELMCVFMMLFNTWCYLVYPTESAASKDEEGILGVKGSSKQLDFEYSCVICRKTFRDYRGFQVHLASHLIPEKHSSPFADFMGGPHHHHHHHQSAGSGGGRVVRTQTWSSPIHSISPNASTPLLSPISSSASTHSSGSV